MKKIIFLVLLGFAACKSSSGPISSSQSIVGTWNSITLPKVTLIVTSDTSCTIQRGSAKWNIPIIWDTLGNPYHQVDFEFIWGTWGTPNDSSGRFDLYWQNSGYQNDYSPSDTLGGAMQVFTDTTLTHEGECTFIKGNPTPEVLTQTFPLLNGSWVSGSGDTVIIAIDTTNRIEHELTGTYSYGLANIILRDVSYSLILFVNYDWASPGAMPGIPTFNFQFGKYNNDTSYALGVSYEHNLGQQDNMNVLIGSISASVPPKVQSLPPSDSIVYDVQDTFQRVR